ncbi:type I-B CRISPR-associated protein Cas5b [Bacillus cytotoxicus]|uniref:type I-B CRISPR-associated protein Cas5b n=1 Tax=Bacillus cytotoxicus TaxID=580165 RepID=UPI00065FBC0B|nr:type I-B CRISPR-associated protein Cas5b [Bacillus cytotoxicus]AWC32899.1 type I-B CRISPR-associated protein Cas5 [Bacillus cytotoxicus]AWC36923.1 type I-B CRISPR-associated protein Cas5 [Bacillus cytotoxicus]AWC61186.1 type I-B CRISPR-associated protein Cas5 [Bacillus cytotoxicus]KMT48369.1 CRISPR-associated protein Cas5 [Bacillus cytotoxicus]MDH2881413.1 type I-B CRISPR-associated protein Cas5b [Bacillus cytotoxicus]
MKVIRLKLFQETACYTKPFANKVAETYPLPPYSTVKGMIHQLLQANELLPLRFSIQGNYETKLIDYRKSYMVKKKSVSMPIIFDGLAMEVPEQEHMTSMPLYTHMLFNVELVIHIAGEEALLERIYQHFIELNQHLSLGRHEDLVRVDEVTFVELEECDEWYSKYAIYAPKYYYKTDFPAGIPYRLNWTYKIVNGIREWNKIPSLYVNGNNPHFEDGKLFHTDGEHIVLWNE